MSHAPTPPAPAARTDHGRDLRLDIEGMRAIAIGTVLLFHAGLVWFPGGFVGVDMFFVLSGYLITGLLVREITTTGRVRLGRFWARRARRLLPASALVLAFTAAVTWVWLPVTQRAEFGGDIVGSALYVVNWRLADRSVDYLAEDVGASPVQHFWSLAVEEQFYVVWPLLMLAVAVVFARRRVLGAFLVLSTITVASFAYSVQQSTASPETAFFVSTTRVWELGVGALLALAAPRLARLPSAVRGLAGWVGLGAIVYATLFFDGSTTWPGVPALVPVLGAAAMIASGIVATPYGPGRLLSLAPLVWIGGLSYSLYLWHWPVLIAGEAVLDDFRVRHGVALTLLAVLPAWLCHKYVENPVRFGARFRPTPRALQLGVALTATGVAMGLALPASSSISAGVTQASAGQAVGAAALTDPDTSETDWSALRSVPRMRPLPVDAVADRPPLYDEQPECQVAIDVVTPEVCEFGDPDGERTVVIVGDSKVVQWQTTLDAIARDEGWRLLQVTKSACSFTDRMTRRVGAVYTECREWGREALRIVLDLDPDLVITSSRRSAALPEGESADGAETPEAMEEGLASYYGTLTDAGIPLVALLDNPDPGPVTPVYECVAQYPEDLRRCTFDHDEGVATSGAPAQLAAVERVPRVSVVDMNDVICPGRETCPPVIGDVLVYRQGTHITTTFADSARPQLADRLAEATDGAFGAG